MPSSGNSSNRIINEDGLVWIKDQKIHVRNHRGAGVPPTIVPGEDVSLIIDGNLYNHLTIVDSNNQIEIKLNDEVTEPSFKITLSDDELYAFCDFKPGTKVYATIKDQEPRNSLTIKVEKQIEYFNNLTEEQILVALSKSGVAFGVKNDVIADILTANKEKRYIIAEGVAPTQGRSAYIEYLYENNIKKEKLTINEQGKIDYRSISKYNFVKEEDVIAVKHKYTTGQNGLSVTGKEIIPQLPNDVTLTAGNGVELDSERLIARAKISGIPNRTVQGNNVIIEVKDCLVINNDIDLSTGNIDYYNSVIINGNVSENMRVNSFDTITVNGNVSFAKVTALNQIAVNGNVISSKVALGRSSLASIKLYEVLMELYNTLDMLILSIEELMQKPSFRTQDVEKQGIGVLVKLLLNLKYNDFPHKIFELYLRTRKNEYGAFSEIAFDVYDLLKIFLTTYTNIVNIEDIMTLKLGLKSYIDKCDIKRKINTNKSGIIIDYALNSEISSDGAVRIEGKGCYNTKIHAKGEVQVKGIFVGGEIFSEKYIKIAEVGTDIGVKSLIETTGSGKIFINKANEGTIIRIGSQSYELNNMEYNISAKLVDGEIVLR